MATAGAIEQIYDQLLTVLGGTNPNQFLTLTVPGMILDAADYAYDTSSEKPATVAQAESLLVDQMFDLAQITDSSNGERVSDQYLQALSVLVPKFDAAMPEVKAKIREYLTSPAPPTAVVDGQPFYGNLGEYYFALYESWVHAKSDWDQRVIAARDSYPTPEKFLEWYEGIAEGQLALIDAAEGRLLSVFSPSDMDALLGALASGPGGAIEEAVTEVLDIRLPSPDGGYVYPVVLTPDNWFLDLASDANPVNLLQDPQFIALTIAARRQAISSSIAQIQALLSQVPSSGQLKAAADALATAQSTYTAAQNALLNTYAANTVTAVEMYLAAETGGASEGLAALDEDVASVSNSAGDEPPATKAAKNDKTPFTDDDLKKLLAGQTTLISAQSSLVSSAQGLASAGMNLASEQAQSFGGLPVMLARLQSQLSDVTNMQGQLGTAAAAAGQRSPAQPVPVLDPSVVTEASKVGSAAQQASGAAPVVLGAIFSAITLATGDGVPVQLHPIYGAANAAWASAVTPVIRAGAKKLDTLTAQVVDAADKAAKPQKATAATVQDAVENLLPAGGSSEEKALQSVVALVKQDVTAGKAAPATAADVAAAGTAISAMLAEATQAALATPGAGATSVFPASAPAAKALDPATAAVSNACSSNPGIQAYFADPTAGIGQITALSAAAASMVQESAQTAAGAMSAVPAPSSTPALSSDRWMELQLSFTSDEMTSNSSDSSLSSQTSWSVDLFLGSASGSSSSAAATSTKSMLSTDTAIQIGMKATKVVINRPWFNPGLFKLSLGMNRLSSLHVAEGPVPFTSDCQDTITSYNKDILPCFPVAFLVVKDVTIQFQAELSQLNAVQSVLDSRSAVGGGFLCFSASSSSAAHSDASSLHSRTEGTVVTINMPGPQILGWFMEFTPADSSDEMTDEAPLNQQDLNILQFIEAIEKYATVPPAPTGPPAGA